MGSQFIFGCSFPQKRHSDVVVCRCPPEIIPMGCPGDKIDNVEAKKLERWIRAQLQLLQRIGYSVPFCKQTSDMENHYLQQKISSTNGIKSVCNDFVQV